MKQQQLPAQQLAYRVAALAITHAVDEETIQAMARIKATAVYIEADTNLIKNAVKKAKKSVNWKTVLNQVLEKYEIKVNSHQAAVIGRAIEIESAKNVEYWEGIDNIFHHLASLEHIEANELTEVDGIYRAATAPTDVNPSILSTVSLYCPDMPIEKKKQFATLLEKTIKQQIAINAI